MNAVCLLLQTIANGMYVERIICRGMSVERLLMEGISAHCFLPGCGKVYAGEVRPWSDNISCVQRDYPC